MDEILTVGLCAKAGSTGAVKPAQLRLARALIYDIILTSALIDDRSLCPFLREFDS
jgi:hypothetical protein